MKFLLPLLPLLLAGCSTVAIPVLRHETGDTLGQKGIRVAARVESARMFPAFAAGSAAINAQQPVDPFVASLVGVTGTIGALPDLDVQLGALWSVNGGGWRLAAKYRFLKKGRFAVAAMLGYNAASGSGTITYATGALPAVTPQTLSVATKEFSIPVSFRVNSAIVLYSGLMYLHSGIQGSPGLADFAGVTQPSWTANDWGTNLGMRVLWNRFEFDFETAVLDVNDPFLNGGTSTRLVPYLGAQVAVLF